MSVTLQVAVHLGRDYLQNLRSIKNQSWKSVEQLFRTTEKLIKNHTEIAGLSTIDWNQPAWRESSPLCDSVNVFSDSVLWKDKIKWYLETRYLKELDRIDGEPMEFECAFSQDSLHWEFWQRFKT